MSRSHVKSQWLYVVIQSLTRFGDLRPLLTANDNGRHDTLKDDTTRPFYTHQTRQKHLKQRFTHILNRGLTYFIYLTVFSEELKIFITS